MQFIRRFISQHSNRCEPFYKLLKGGAEYVWDDECQAAFDGMKYLLNPPVWVPPVPGRPLRLYLSATDNAIGVVLFWPSTTIQERKRGQYTISASHWSNMKENTTHMEKTCLALVWASQKLRHYFLDHSVRLLARMDPLPVRETCRIRESSSLADAVVGV